MNEKILEKFIDDLKENVLVKRLKELNGIINTKYKDEVLAFNNLKEKFAEIKQYGAFHPDYEKTKNELHYSRINLLSKPEVKEYKDKERALEKMLLDLSEEIKRKLLWLKEKV